MTRKNKKQPLNTSYYRQDGGYLCKITQGGVTIASAWGKTRHEAKVNAYDALEYNGEGEG
jgi:hypothetical protein